MATATPVMILMMLMLVLRLTVCVSFALKCKMPCCIASEPCIYCRRLYVIFIFSWTGKYSAAVAVRSSLVRRAEVPKRRLTQQTFAMDYHMACLVSASRSAN